MDRRLVDYIRTNRQIYTRAAVSDKLRAEGYTDEEIDAAWQQLLTEDAEAERAAASRRDTSSNQPSLGCLIGFLATLGVVLVGLVDIGWWLASGFSSSISVAPLLWFVNLGSLVVLIALWAGASWLAGRKSWSPFQVGALIAAVALIWYLIVAGTCIYGPRLL